ncbi:MAG TPA: ATP-binding protein, partial [bacterium]|nr:ATP-binding protein [bacterium]
RSGQRAERSRERDQVAWIVWGIGIGAVPFVILFTLPAIFGQEPMIPLAVTRLFSIACPLAFALAIVKHQFLDIDVIVRRSLIFAGLAAVLVFVYFLLGVWLEGFLGDRLPTLARVVSVAAVVVPVLLFGPTRRWIARAVDRSLFQIRDSQRRALEDLGERLRETLRHEDVVEALRGAVEDSLRPRRCAVLLRQGGRTVRAGDDGDPRTGDRVFADFAEWFLAPGRPVAATEATAVPELESDRFPPAVREAGYVLAVPVPVSDDCRALILLGERRSGRRYLDLDLDFTAGVAARALPALERVGLVQRIAEEAMARSQLDELNRQKSEFLSRVAHDLRTPITSIRWSVQNLIDGVAGETTSKQREYLGAMHASVGHLSRLVEDLLEIGRLESGAAEVRITRVDLDSVVEESLQTLRPIAGAKDVRLETRIPSREHRARANADMVLAVVNNLVENAVRFAPKESAVEVSLTRDDRWQRLTVRDRGPGVPETDREAIFERFRQGTARRGDPGRGFGLGLYVVRSFLEAMDGRVWAENHPDGGACFVCLIPAWQPEAE